jgi:BirA family transcriptional regulator, biotin operon repressor / biotin---[acetyl-CoA-carboxylase] ligase
MSSSHDYREPLDAARLAEELPSFSGPWTAIEIVPQTGSTNTDLLDWAGRGLHEGVVLVAEEQTAGRGRMGRSWESPPGAALTFSVLLRPEALPPARRPWLPLVAGIGTVTSIRMLTGLEAELKWPNDVLIGGRKVAGILAEAAGNAVVVGIGVNVSTTPEELAPGPGGLAPTSLLAEGVPVGRDLLLIEILRSLGQWYKTLAAEPDPERIGLLAQYHKLSATVGRDVRVELPGGQSISGLATGIDADGQLLVEADGGMYQIAAGDVIHVRSSSLMKAARVGGGKPSGLARGDRRLQAAGESRRVGYAIRARVTL